MPTTDPLQPGLKEVDMKQRSLFIIVTIITTTLAAEPHEDSYYAKFGPAHTMVLYKPNTPKNPVPNCGIDPANNITIAKTGILPQADRDAFVKAHNKFRRYVAKGLQPRQPPAANMEEVKWDNELAAIAQRWAEQCPDGSTSLKAHDDNRSVDAFNHVGQNTFWDKSQSIYPWYPGPGLSAPAYNAVQWWYREVSYFNPALIKNYQVVEYPETKHYTQLAWATSSTIGCGFFMRKAAEDQDRHVLINWERWIVCNYGPGGNVVGKQMYKEGDAGSACPTGKRNNDGLCS